MNGGAVERLVVDFVKDERLNERQQCLKLLFLRSVPLDRVKQFPTPISLPVRLLEESAYVCHRVGLFACLVRVHYDHFVAVELVALPFRVALRVHRLPSVYAFQHP